MTNKSVKQAAIEDASLHLESIINDVAYGGERIVVVKNQDCLCAIVPIEDFELLEELEDSIDLKISRKAKEELGK